ncbi:probable tRNA N6-adenosine threonylcarbamoyltransferase, mitochondrial [Hyalella azteca]|uniref:N(6)-L-threonylcarbamoyladenine synthase n=1 Tax=Hyalella azteca TaxID=294128 RepID=A0A8B7N671_HYAAZ|nr:probable tRNA N6-adenosine threonylcarbamoyltransferase, mitochondrial [Hyalella azteca]
MSSLILKCRCSLLWKRSKLQNGLQRLQSTMAVLGIETSCDDTGAAVIDGTNTVLGEAIHQQTREHMLHGGIRPPLAQSLHAENIHSVVTSAMQKSGLDFSDLSAIATTVKPGLPMSLLVGAEYGKQLALKHRLAFIPIHHMEAHTLTVRLTNQVDFPFLCLLASASIIAARYLNLRMLRDYMDLSGGAAIERLAEKGNAKAYNIIGQKSPLSAYRDCNFSFSGLKSNLDVIVRQLEKEHGLDGDSPLELPLLQDLSASFQHAVCQHIVRRTHRAMLYYSASVSPQQQCKTLVVSGGVASNASLRGWLDKLCSSLGGWRLVCPPPQLCTDNGVMVAWNGLEKLRAMRGVITDPAIITDVQVQAKCPLGEDASQDVAMQSIKVSKWIKA